MHLGIDKNRNPDPFGPTRDRSGVTLKGRFYSWEYFRVTPNEALPALLAKERKAGEKAGERRAEKRAKEATRKAAQQAAEKAAYEPADRTASCYWFYGGAWRWHVWDEARGGLVDTGWVQGAGGVPVLPQDGKPLPAARFPCEKVGDLLMSVPDGWKRITREWALGLAAAHGFKGRT